MARYSGIYLHFEGATAECNSMQVARELVFDTDSGLFRYMDALSGVHYIDASGFDFSGYWEQIPESGGILYAGSVGTCVYLGDPSATNIFMEITPSVTYAGLHTKYSMTLCGTSLTYKDNGFTAFYADSGLFNIYDGSLNFQKGDNAVPAWRISSNGTDNLLISGCYGDFTLNSYFGITLLTYSGDTNISGSAGNTYITQDGDESSNTGNVIISGAGDVYSTPWQTYSPAIAGFASLSTSKTKYKTIGDLVFVRFQLIGSGNSDVTEINLPYPPEDSGWAFKGIFAGSGTANYSESSAFIYPGTSTLMIKTSNILTGNGDTFGAGAAKWVCGQIWYQKA